MPTYAAGCRLTCCFAPRPPASRWRPGWPAPEPGAQRLAARASACRPVSTPFGCNFGAAARLSVEGGRGWVPEAAGRESSKEEKKFRRFVSDKAAKRSPAATLSWLGEFAASRRSPPPHRRQNEPSFPVTRTAAPLLSLLRSQQIRLRLCVPVTRMRSDFRTGAWAPDWSRAGKTPRSRRWIVTLLLRNRLRRQRHLLPDNSS